jgi:uncharacterized protein (DUF305 family)
MEQNMNQAEMKNNSYKKFWITLAISFFIMYSVMFLNMDDSSHYHTSLTRIYMALLMVAPMAVVMMLMMGKMYPNRKTNLGIMVAGTLVFIISLVALRTQTPISDVQYMKAMIPHHSSAIMVSKRANLKDPEVKKLSEQIIKSQEEEITQMQNIIERMKK